MRRCLMLGILMALLVGCAEAPASPAPMAYGTVVEYTDPLTKEHDTIVALYDKPVDSAGLVTKVGAAHEGERVAIMERRADGNVRIRTNIYEEGWTRIEALKDISFEG
ncbi:MAG TPA: hypothetical protein VFU22_20705 [Roseiflexaceae bacterium]|nr:hypothetical protein [Roseiflexaceae bacterium]